jgi:hypothetical protein
LVRLLSFRRWRSRSLLHSALGGHMRRGGALGDNCCRTHPSLRHMASWLGTPTGATQ